MILKRPIDIPELERFEILALKKIASAGSDFRKLSDFPGVGIKSIEALLLRGLIKEGKEGMYPNDRAFMLTDLGWRALRYYKG